MYFQETLYSYTKLEIKTNYSMMTPVFVCFLKIWLEINTNYLVFYADLEFFVFIFFTEWMLNSSVNKTFYSPRCIFVKWSAQTPNVVRTTRTPKFLKNQIIHACLLHVFVSEPHQEWSISAAPEVITLNSWVWAPLTPQNQKNHYRLCHYFLALWGSEPS